MKDSTELPASANDSQKLTDISIVFTGNMSDADTLNVMLKGVPEERGQD